MEIHEKINIVADGFNSCSELLAAIGDETRQYLILEMIKIGSCNGLRVCEIAKKTNLSRPAVSHHLQVMKNAGIVKMRKEGTKNYYYFDPDPKTFELLISTLQTAVEISIALPERSEYDV